MVLPITLFVLLPLTIICALLKPIVRLVKPKQPRKKPPPPLPKSELSVPDPSQRKYDLVLLGATGFTGFLLLNIETFLFNSFSFFSFFFLFSHVSETPFKNPSFWMNRKFKCSLFGQTIWIFYPLGHCWQKKRWVNKI